MTAKEKIPFCPFLQCIFPGLVRPCDNARLPEVENNSIPYLVKSMLASASASALQLRPKLCVSSDIWHREVGWKNQAQLSLKTNFEMYGYRMNESLSRVFNIGSQNKVNCFVFFFIRLEAKFAKSYDDQNHCYVVISFVFWLRQSIFTHLTSIYANLFGTKESFYVRKKV